MTSLKRFFPWVIAVCLSVLLLAGYTSSISGKAQVDACMPGPHSGIISASQTWCPIDNPHRVTGGVTVPDSVTLTIEAGVTVIFDTGTFLQVDKTGTLNAPGSEALPIVFTSSVVNPAPGDWNALVALAHSTVNMSWIDLSYAGYGGDPRAIWVMTGANFQMHHSHIHHNLGNGILLDGAGLSAILDDIEIDHNSLNAILQTTVDMNPSYNDIDIHDNGTNALVVNGDYLHRPVTLDGSPAALKGAPIILRSSDIHTQTHTLNITAGTLLKFGPGLSLVVENGGILEAWGVQGLPVTFTSSAASPAPGDWNAITALGGSYVYLHWIDLSCAGYGADPRALWVTGATFQIHHSRIHDNLGNGVRLGGGGLSAIFNDVEIDHNAGAAIFETTIRMNPNFTNVRIHDNGLDALHVNGDYLHGNVTLDGSPTALNGAPIVISTSSIDT